ncbi:MAG: hypothetical protein ACI4S3_03680 [Candidatus Gastranaerophilaceae bacterium]
MSPSVEPFNEAKYKALMDGLEICEKRISFVNTATDILRLEAEFFNAAILHTVKTVKGADIVDLIQYGTSEELNDDKSGYPILRLNEFDNAFIKEPARYCDKISEQEYSELKLNQDDVLICRTNGNPNLVGRSAVVMEDMPYAFASYLFRVRTNALILPHVLVAYLRGKNGRAEIDKYSMKGNQTNFSPAKFREIDVPIFEQSFQEEIKNTITEAYRLHISAKKIFCQAETILNTYLNINGLEDKNCVVKILSESFMQSGRLDAEYYQPKYDVLFETLSRFTTMNLSGKNGLVNIKKSIEPGSEAYQDEGIPFVRVSDVNKYGLAEPSIKIPYSTVPDIESLYPCKDTILLSKDGSVGIAYKVQEDMQVVTSGALLHLTVKDTNQILPDYLTLVLNSQVVQLQAERDCNGAIIQHWKPDDIEKVLIPVLDMDKQKEISDKVQESFRLRKEAKRLLDNAIKAVEMAIETDEESAIEWLESTNGEFI